MCEEISSVNESRSQASWTTPKGSIAALCLVCVAGVLMLGRRSADIAVGFIGRRRCPTLLCDIRLRSFGAV